MCQQRTVGVKVTWDTENQNYLTHMKTQQLKHETYICPDDIYALRKLSKMVSFYLMLIMIHGPQNQNQKASVCSIEHEWTLDNLGSHKSKTTQCYCVLVTPMCTLNQDIKKPDSSIFTFKILEAVYTAQMTDVSPSLCLGEQQENNKLRLNKEILNNHLILQKLLF